MAEIGDTLGGRYRLIELLGQGGMATIFRAMDTQLGRDVAVKLLRPEYLRDPDFSSRFRQEAQAAASLSHPNVVAVYDYGSDRSGPYIVMELVDGEDLATILKGSGALPPRQVARIGSAVARALAASHAAGLVHRDVKPGNILIGRDGQVKVADFGIARAIAEAQLTLPGTTMGSVHYFSPEQARGEQATASSDIYSLGIVLYEMLTGSRPYQGDSAAAVGIARLSGPVPDPSLIRASVPPDLSAITRKALAPEPAGRFGSAAAMADALDATLDPGAGGLRMAGAGAVAGSAVASGVASANPGAMPYAEDAYATAPSQAPPPRAVPSPVDDRPAGNGPGPVVWVAGALAIALLAAIAYLVFQLASGSSPEEPKPAVTVPNFVGQLIVDATRTADGLGIVLKSTPEDSTEPVGTILAQIPSQGLTVPAGGTVEVTVAAGVGTVPVPDLRTLTEQQAVQAIADAGLLIGLRSDAFDPLAPVGTVISQSPAAGVVVARSTAIDYVLSKGPEPSATPSPTPTPTPTPTPSPTPSPTPTPTPSPTPTPTPTPTLSPPPSPSP